MKGGGKMNEIRFYCVAREGGKWLLPGQTGRADRSDRLSPGS